MKRSITARDEPSIKTLMVLSGSLSICTISPMTPTR